jgi:hypothetical protein
MTAHHCAVSLMPPKTPPASPQGDVPNCFAVVAFPDSVLRLEGGIEDRTYAINFLAHSSTALKSSSVTATAGASTGSALPDDG